MKLVKLTKELKPEFQEFYLTLKVESFQDAQKLRFIFNSYQIVQGLDLGKVARDVRYHLDENVPKIVGDDNFQKYSNKVFDK